MKRANRYLWLIPITLAVTIADQLINVGLNYPFNIFPIYHIVGWSVVWFIVFLLFKRRWLLSLGLTILVAVAEDFLYLMYEALIGKRAFYPVYSHDWQLIAQDWLGIPSTYVFGIMLGLVLIWAGRQLKR